MATEICLTVSLGHELEAFISNADTTGKSYRFHYGTRTFTPLHKEENLDKRINIHWFEHVEVFRMYVLVFS